MTNYGHIYLAEHINSCYNQSLLRESKHSPNDFKTNFKKGKNINE